MTRSKSNWRRVSRSKPCPVCHKPDWCLVAVDDAAAICSRIESDKPAGRNGAGWVHQLRDDYWRRPTWWSAKRAEFVKPTVSMRELAVACRNAVRKQSLHWLANELGVSVEALKWLRVGWSESWKAYSFPMREPNGNVCGIRYRKHGGSKFSEPDSRNGLFFQPRLLSRDYLAIVEGASDTAAALDLGFNSVIGRAACRTNVDDILTLCRRKRPRRCVIVPDNDEPGIEGAASLVQAIELAGGAAELLRLPDGVKDVRQCIQDTKNAEWLAGELGKLCGTEPQARKEAGCERDNYTPAE